MFMNAIILLIIILVLYIYLFYKKAYSFFEKCNIPYVKPTIFFGNITKAALKKKSMIEVYTDIYRKLEPHKIGGFYNFHKPTYIVRDPELIKIIFVKDFEYFTERGFGIGSEDEPLTRHLGNMHGEAWKNLRIKLTPTFSSGKMKNMFLLIKICGNNLVKVLERFTPNEDVEIKDLCARYTTDVMGTCAFGLETNTLENPKSELREITKEALDNSLPLIIRTFVPDMSPKLVKLFNLRVFSKNVERFFYSVILDTIKYREENKIIRYDFLDLLIGLKNNTDINKFKDERDAKDLKKFLAEIGNHYIESDVDMTDDVLVAQAFIFLIGGIETSSSALSFLILELALNPDIQNKLRNEIITILESNENELTYETMKQMKYTDMVIAEILRKHPTSGFTLRTCVKNYRIPETNVIINKDDKLLFPIHALHMDKKYYEKPEEFYPEHFTEEAIATRPPFTYLPFGEGPRICIAVRFAKMQIKVGLIHLLRNTFYVPSPRMKFPAKYCAGMDFITNMEGGVWVRSRKM